MAQNRTINGMPRITWDEFKAAMEAKGVTGDTILRFMDFGCVETAEHLLIKVDTDENSVTVE